MSVQAPGAVVMIRPHHFHPNTQTRDDNGFQSNVNAPTDEVAAHALREFDQAVAQLENAGITCHVFDDTGAETPDSVFPNNWFSTHAGGHIAIYPMYTANRRKERRWDIIETLKHDYRVQDVIDYSGLEADNLSLEGTGAMVLDHIGRIAYVARSNRADPVLLERFCTHFNYEPMAFDAHDAAGRAVYHTNVLMTVGTEFALVGLDMIGDASRRAEVRHRLEETGRHVIALSTEQIGQFCGNALELSGAHGSVLALSKTAIRALSTAERKAIEQSAALLPLSIPTIETAGGSVRRMLAGIHLSRR